MVLIYFQESFCRQETKLNHCKSQPGRLLPPAIGSWGLHPSPLSRLVCVCVLPWLLLLPGLESRHLFPLGPLPPMTTTSQEGAQSLRGGRPVG